MNVPRPVTQTYEMNIGLVILLKMILSNRTGEHLRVVIFNGNPNIFFRLDGKIRVLQQRILFDRSSKKIFARNCMFI